MFPGVPGHTGAMEREAALAEIRKAMAVAGVKASEVARDSGLDYGTVYDFLSGARNTRNVTVIQIERSIPGWPEGRFAALLADIDVRTDDPKLPEPGTVELPAPVIDGLAPTELEELFADLIARSWAKSAEIKGRPGRVDIVWHDNDTNPTEIEVKGAQTTQSDYAPAARKLQTPLPDEDDDHNQDHGNEEPS